MVLTGNGRIAAEVTVSRYAAKKGRAPLNPDLAQTLRLLHDNQARSRSGLVIRSERGTHMTARSVVNWFHGVYDTLGLQGMLVAFRAAGVHH